MKILSVDPGTHTGWAFVDTVVGVAGSFCGGELQVANDDPDGDYRMALDLMELAERKGLGEEGDHFVVEDFILLPASVKGGMNSARSGLSSVRVASSLYALLRTQGWSDDEVYWQQPSVMTVIDSGRLKRAGMWVIGSEHARDAAKHLLIHLRRDVRSWAD